MKASELIATLKKSVEENGDAEIYIENIVCEIGDDGVLHITQSFNKCTYIAYYVPAYWNKRQRMYCIEGRGGPSFERK